ncbi:hypothetical protein Ddye_000116 [Dipteronia dyeriana]|uniref:RNase H type-1 domain-containing protein n=1 Tax=Dipteronia dyeriana TaxID=168575 RepID=A0AAE0CS89_9ROSI|nr:hypothetical protein Ddye_000116 [Dipteronia dyeriana]
MLQFICRSFRILEPLLDQMDCIPPPFGCLKHNSDAAVKDNLSFCGVGVFIRNHEGKELAAISKKILGRFTPEIGEFLALREGLLLAKHLNIKVDFVESDASNVIAGVANDLCSLGPAGLVIDDIKSLCKVVGVSKCYAISIVRNSVAHSLASEMWIDQETNIII